MSEVKFTEEELKSLEELQKGYLDVQSKFGQVVIARINLKKQNDKLNLFEEETNKNFEDLQNKEKELVSGLTEKYGEGSLDVNTGVFSSYDKESTK
tara:strand:+ start:1706 stop:1993 length:288 start_codon:yes stop_codon:yes gene_type:complete